MTGVQARRIMPWLASAGISSGLLSTVPAACASFAMLAGCLLVMPSARAQTINSANRGNYGSDGFSLATSTSYFAGINSNSSGIVNRDFFVFTIPTLAAGQQYVSATFRFNTFNIVTGDPSETLGLRDYTGSISALIGGMAAGPSGIAVYTDLGDGADYGSITLTPTQSNQFVTVSLTGAALAGINAAAGNQFAFGGLITTTDATRRNEFVAGNSTGTAANDGNTQLILTTGGVSAAAPEPASLLLVLSVLGAASIGMRLKVSRDKATQ